MNGVTGQAWIKDDFDAQTQDKANGHYRLLIVDGHTSHFNYELLQYAKANHIVVLCLLHIQLTSYKVSGSQRNCGSSISNLL